MFYSLFLQKDIKKKLIIKIFLHIEQKNTITQRKWVEIHFLITKTAKDQDHCGCKAFFFKVYFVDPSMEAAFNPKRLKRSWSFCGIGFFAVSSFCP
jgi:hypothetical protein